MTEQIEHRKLQALNDIAAALSRIADALEEANSKTERTTGRTELGKSFLRVWDIGRA